MMVAGEILDVIAEKVSHSGGVRALYGLTDAAHAVCKQKLSQDVVTRQGRSGDQSMDGGWQLETKEPQAPPAVHF